MASSGMCHQCRKQKAIRKKYSLLTSSKLAQPSLDWDSVRHRNGALTEQIHVNMQENE